MKPTLQPLIVLVILLAGVLPRAWSCTPALTDAETILIAQRARPDAAQFEHAKTLTIQAVTGTPRDACAWTLLAWTHLIEHRFALALEAAQRAESLQPGAPRTLALMSDALVELGRYDEAATRTQQLVDTAPGPAAWVRAAHLRFLLGDLPGAIAIQSMAARAGAARGEASAWIWLDLARLHLAAAAPAAAAEAITAAAVAFPELPGLPAARARLQLAQGDAPGALVLYRQALEVQTTAEDAVAAWRIARQHGDAGTATHLRALLEGLAQLDVQGLSRRTLAEYFAESGDLARALELARAELAARPDIYSQATLARVLARAGQPAQARAQAHAALALGTQDPDLRAGLIELLGAADRAGTGDRR